MKNKEYKTGDIIKLKKEHAKTIKDAFSGISAIETEILMLFEKINRIRQDQWDFVHQMYPGTEGFNLNFDRNKETVIVKNKA